MASSFARSVTTDATGGTGGVGGLAWGQQASMYSTKLYGALMFAPGYV